MDEYIAATFELGMICFCSGFYLNTESVVRIVPRGSFVGNELVSTRILYANHHLMGTLAELLHDGVSPLIFAHFINTHLEHCTITYCKKFHILTIPSKKIQLHCGITKLAGFGENGEYTWPDLVGFDMYWVFRGRYDKFIQMHTPSIFGPSVFGGI